MEMEGTPRMLKPVEQNIYKFQEKKKNITRTKLGKTMIRGLGGTNEQIEELKDLFDNDTEMTVIKEATAQELIDDTTTLWDYIKKSFRKVKKNE
jgi:ferritin-like metal-binding protein YciE